MAEWNLKELYKMVEQIMVAPPKPQTGQPDVVNKLDNLFKKQKEMVAPVAPPESKLPQLPRMS